MPAAAPRWARRSCDRTRRQRPDETTAPVSWVRRIWADSQPNQPVCREHVGWAKAPCTPRTFNAKTAAPCPRVTLSKERCDAWARRCDFRVQGACSLIAPLPTLRSYQGGDPLGNLADRDD